MVAVRYHSTPAPLTALRSPHPEHTRQQVQAYFIAQGCRQAEPFRLRCGKTDDVEVDIQTPGAGEVWVTRYAW